MRSPRSLLSLAVLAGACQHVPPAAGPCQLVPEELGLTTTDGVRLSCHWYPARSPAGPRPALLMLHGGNQYKERWAESGLLEDLADLDFHYLAVDIRGRGSSEAGDPEALRRDPTLAREDLRAALAWLRRRPDVDPGRIALLGSSYGANLICAGQLGWGIEARATVCFSVTRAAERWLELGAGEVEGRPRAGLFLACEDEPARYEAAATARRMAARCREGGEVEVFPGRIHALWIYEQVPAARAAVRRYLCAQLQKP